MPYRPQRDTPRDRVRSVVGETKDPPTLTGGEASYDAILAATLSEHMAARVAARDLAAQLSKDPDKLGSGGASLAWTERVSYLLKIWTGAIPTGLAGDPSLTPAASSSATVAGSGDVPTQATW